MVVILLCLNGTCTAKIAGVENEDPACWRWSAVVRPALLEKLPLIDKRANRIGTHEKT
jgi:hypothetical protein